MYVRVCVQNVGGFRGPDLSMNILPTNEAIIDYLYLQLYINHELTKLILLNHKYFDPLKITRYTVVI